jgi:hypothetical protein
MAGGSVAALVNAETSGGSNDINTLAASQIAQIDLAQKRMAATAYTQWRDAGSPGNFRQFQENFQMDNDPRAYLSDLLSADQRQNMINGMNDRERARYGMALTKLQATDKLHNGFLLTLPHVPSPLPPPKGQ